MRHEQRQRLQGAGRATIDHRVCLTYAFLPPSASQFTSVNIVIKDSQLGLNGVAVHIFPAVKVNWTASKDVFAFSAPLNLMLHPNATYYFQPATSLSVSG